MKTNITLTSKDRDLFGITIKQNTKEQFLSITDLQKAYEKARWIYGWNEKRINDILSNKDTKERIYYLLKERDLIKAEIPVFMEMTEKEGIVKVLKGLDIWKTTGRGENKCVMSDPYIWMLLAMELNPMLYAKVIFWLTDSLVFDRIEAGSEYKPMNTAIKSIIESPDYVKYAKLINKTVFGHHQSGMRNLASANELKNISSIERFIISAIEIGLIRDDNDIISVITNFKLK